MDKKKKGKVLPRRNCKECGREMYPYEDEAISKGTLSYEYCYPCLDSIIDGREGRQVTKARDIFEVVLKKIVQPLS